MGQCETLCSRGLPLHHGPGKCISIDGRTGAGVLGVALQNYNLKHNCLVNRSTLTEREEPSRNEYGCCEARP